MDEDKLGWLVLLLYPILGALLLWALLSNTYWTPVVIVAGAGLWWFTRHNHRQLRDTTADGLPMESNNVGEDPPTSSGGNTL